MFQDAKVGDRVWSVRIGWGTVVGIVAGNIHPVKVQFDHRIIGVFGFSTDGKYSENDRYPELYWDEVKIVPPPRPKRMIKKELWQNIYKSNDTRAIETYRGFYTPNTYLFRSKDEALKNIYSSSLKYIGTFPIIIEVEE